MTPSIIEVVISCTWSEQSFWCNLCNWITIARPSAFQRLRIVAFSSGTRGQNILWVGLPLRVLRRSSAREWWLSAAVHVGRTTSGLVCHFASFGAAAAEFRILSFGSKNLHVVKN